MNGQTCNSCEHYVKFCGGCKIHSKDVPLGNDYDNYECEHEWVKSGMNSDCPDYKRKGDEG